MKAKANPKPVSANTLSRSTIGWEEVSRYRVARLATADARGKPLVVPVCFACGKDAIYSVLDEKPKRVAASRLRRVRNIQVNPQVSLLVDHYEEDWSRLAYILVAGTAEVLSEETQPNEHAEALRLLREKYPQYRAMRLKARPVIKISPRRTISWKAGPAAE
ncbi:MAG: TIGR03668 family PPOX class F420-dependent oxidoreductase [Terriglobia bacterium]